MLAMEIRTFQPIDEPQVVALWQRCQLTRPWNNPHKDIQRKLKVQPHLFLVGVIGPKVVATAMAGYEGHRGWVNYLAVAPEHQRQGLGQALMAEVERRLQEAGCPKINVQVRSSNREILSFYQQMGYTIDDVISLGKRLEQDEPPQS